MGTEIDLASRFSARSLPAGARFRLCRGRVWGSQARSHRIPVHSGSSCIVVPQKGLPRGRGMEQENYARYPSLRDRVVLITGGATGIGESLVRHFAHQGCRVAFFDVQDEPGHALAEGLATEGYPRPEYSHCDLANVPEVQAA